jgi:hypothetical protein
MISINLIGFLTTHPREHLQSLSNQKSFIRSSSRKNDDRTVDPKPIKSPHIFSIAKADAKNLRAILNFTPGPSV